MSLDILKCKIVSPEKAKNTYSVEDNPYLKQIQPTGFVCVDEFRVGRNCLSEKWHTKWGLAQESKWDSHLNIVVELETQLDCNKMIIVYPNEVKEKILSYLDLEDGFLHDITGDDFDFLYISW